MQSPAIVQKNTSSGLHTTPGFAQPKRRLQICAGVSAN